MPPATSFIVPTGNFGSDTKGSPLFFVTKTMFTPNTFDLEAPPSGPTEGQIWPRGGSGWMEGGGGGLDQATADDRYVNVTGDTMTGKLSFKASDGASIEGGGTKDLVVNTGVGGDVYMTALDNFASPGSGGSMTFQVDREFTVDAIKYVHIQGRERVNIIGLLDVQDEMFADEGVWFDYGKTTRVRKDGTKLSLEAPAGGTVNANAPVILPADPAADMQAATKKYVDSKGGSTILSGTAKPTETVGSIGNYYLDTDSDVLYGPKVAAAAGEYVTPPCITSGTTPGEVWGMKFRFSNSGYITDVRVFVTADADTASEVYVFSSAGALLASKDFTATLNAWNTVTLATPLPVVAGTTYVVAYWAMTRIQFSNSDYLGQVSGNVVGLANGVDGDACVYKAGRDSFPNTGIAFSIGISPVFNTIGSVWPVAVFGVPPGGATGQVLKKTSTEDYAISWGDYWGLWTGTQAAYTALGTYDDRVLYVVVG